MVESDLFRYYCIVLLVLASQQLSGAGFVHPPSPTSFRQQRGSLLDLPFAPPKSHQQEHRSSQRKRPTSASTATTTTLFNGRGVAANYTWTEDQFEIEICVKIPKEVRASNVFFKATSTTIDLRYRLSENDDDDTDTEEADEIILLDKNRTLKGKINLDGTYWLIGDVEEQPADHRVVTVTIEKHIPRARDDFEPIEYDWKAVYKLPDPTITLCEYDKPEPLNVREYAAGMGVDIDNIDMSKVDKTMFSSGLNVSRSTMDQMYKSGLLSEDTITRQADGTEYKVSDDGDPVPYSLEQEVPGSGNAVTVVKDDNNNSSGSGNSTATTPTVMRQVRNMTRAAFALDSAVAKAEGKANKGRKKDTNDATSKDPIDGLTVERLKQMLRSQGLPVSGKKSVLQDRLRRQVNALMQGKQDDPK